MAGLERLFQQMFENFDPEVALTYAALFVFGLLAMTLHECAHGYVAYRLGDTTAKDAGRLTLNPIKHIDPIGLACIIFFRIGWAKPVPVDSRNFKNRRSGIRLVSIAGPLANVALCFVCLAGLKVSLNLNSEAGAIVFFNGLALNVGFAIFNLFPFPPLDGSKILFSFLPEKLEYYFYRYQNVLS
ncbi:MAG: site-2 protease family protein, partial [Eubacteriaceae bacterium]|nr:site-2 protease family protein [Eubacteriaceae bacterium]